MHNRANYAATSVRFLCPVCGMKLKVNADVNAYEVSCPECSSLIMTPAVGVGPGTRLDDFLLGRWIGRGAMGEVFLAEQQSLLRTVAVKILSPAWGRNPEMTERFQREVRTLAQLQHPHIVIAFAAGQSRGVHYLAMQYVKGGSLQELVHHQGPMTEVEALSVAYTVADALRYAWRDHGLIHRDIKPANIMVDPEGEVRITDLGISKCIYEEESVTRGHRVFGTPAFMSPEQARGELDLDFRSDQYSLGATVYHLLTGGPPFDTADVDKAIRMLGARQRPPPVHAQRTDLSPACRACLERMMAVEPMDRFRSWSEVMDAVGSVLAAHPTRELVMAPEGKTGANRPRRKKKRPVIMRLAVVAIVAAGGLLGYRWAETHSLVAEWVPGDLREAGRSVSEPYRRAEGAVNEFLDERAAEKEMALRAAEIMDVLDQQAALQVVKGHVDKAIAVYRDYEGPLADETKPERRKRIAELSLPD